MIDTFMVDAFMVIMLIASILALIFILRCLIGIFACDYDMWKRKKKEKDYHHKVEDKFKNRKLTD